MSNTKAKGAGWKRWLFSETLLTKNRSHKIAYVAVMTALVVAANMFFEFKLAEAQISLTLAISGLTGIILGPLPGFAACFLGDLVGFLYNSAGYAYYPWIGISMGFAAVIAGLIIGVVPGKKPWILYVKLTMVCLLTFLLCTVAINTTFFWLLRNIELGYKLDYGEYLVWRLFLNVPPQIWNSLFNAVVLFLSVPLLKRIKPLKIQV